MQESGGEARAPIIGDIHFQLPETQGSETVSIHDICCTRTAVETLRRVCNNIGDKTLKALVVDFFTDLEIYSNGNKPEILPTIKATAAKLNAVIEFTESEVLHRVEIHGANIEITKEGGYILARDESGGMISLKDGFGNSITNLEAPHYVFYPLGAQTLVFYGTPVDGYYKSCKFDGSVHNYKFVGENIISVSLLDSSQEIIHLLSSRTLGIIEPHKSDKVLAIEGYNPTCILFKTGEKSYRLETFKADIDAESQILEAGDSNNEFKYFDEIDNPALLSLANTVVLIYCINGLQCAYFPGADRTYRGIQISQGNNGLQITIKGVPMTLDGLGELVTLH